MNRPNFNRRPVEDDAHDADGPAAEGARQYRARGNRGGRGRPRGGGDIRPPRFEQPRTVQPPRAVPRPAHVNDSEFKNDPLNIESLAPEPGQESRPVPKEVRVFPGARALPLFTEVLHRNLTLNSSYGKHVPESATAVYVATMTYARMLHLLNISNRRISMEEKAFVDKIYNGNFKVPKALASYLSGFGDFTANGREHRFGMDDRLYQESDDDHSKGWFGRVNAQNHYKYIEYPCLAVFMRRIVQDLQYTADAAAGPMWNLPADIRCEADGCGYPTENLLGWKRAERLSRAQATFLMQAGVLDDGYNSIDGLVALSDTLINAIATEMEHATEMVPLPDGRSGSTAQVIVTIPTGDDETPVVRAPTIAQHLYKLPGTVVNVNKSFRYHIAPPYNEVRTWSAYEFQDFKEVPDDWADSVDHIFDLTSDELRQAQWTVAESESATLTRVVVGNYFPQR